MIFFYLFVITFFILLIIGGYESTMRLVRYIDLTLNYQIIQIRMWFFKKNIEKELLKDLKEFNKHRENKNV